MRIEFLNEINLNPGAGIEFDFEDHRFASERIHRPFADISQASSSRVGIGF
jgi:hypothetical protein